MKKVTGIGGVFFKCKDPQNVKSWYEKHLGFKTDQHGSLFMWHPLNNVEAKAYTAWSPFSETTEYFLPSQKEFMINYRVENLVELLDALRKEGVEIIGELQEYEYGKFAHIIDPEGNKIELWEPIDKVFTDMGGDNII